MSHEEKRARDRRPRADDRAAPHAPTGSPSRVAWPLPLDPTLRRRVEQERETFDEVAAQRLLRVALPMEPRSPRPEAFLDLHGEPNKRLAALLRKLPSKPESRPFTGCRVLELGGSGEATGGFLAAGASRVDQLDVSPGMLDLAWSRLEPQERGRVFQHVAAAESVPFEDSVFDIVFSRHCLHHMQRERVFPEVARVLKPSGWFLFIEPYLPTWIRRLVTLRRAVRGVDRGADDPLTPIDLVRAGRVFRRLDVRGEPNAAVLFRSLPWLASRLRRLERRYPLPSSVLGRVGGRVMVLAREPVAAHARF